MDLPWLFLTYDIFLLYFAITHKNTKIQMMLYNGYLLFYLHLIFVTLNNLDLILLIIFLANLNIYAIVLYSEDF